MQPARAPWGAWWRVDRHDLLWLLALTLVAGLLRFASPVFLDVLSRPASAAPISAWGIGHSYQDPSVPGIGQPNEISPNAPFIFDETYFANDAHADLQGRDYFDPEPPLSKLIIAIGIQLFGFNSFGWRVMSGLFGTALVPLMYLLARQLLGVRFFAVVAGLLTSFDGMTFVQSRIGMIDIFPIVLVVLSYLLFHLHLNADSRTRQRVTIALTAVLLGLAIGAKWISLAAYGTVIVLLVYRLAWKLTRYDRRTAAVVILSLAFLPAIFYGLTYTRYLTIAHSLTNYAAPALSFSPLHLDVGRAWQELAEFHRQTWLYHINLKAPHIFYSPWWSWPLLFRPVVYYYQSAGLGTDPSTGSGLVAEIFNLGNPAIWWAAVAALLTLLVTQVGDGVAFLRLRFSGARDEAAALVGRNYPVFFVLLAFVAAWLPFSRIHRGLFLYHMFGALPFMILAVALVLTRLRGLRLTVPFGAFDLHLNGLAPAYAYLAMVVAFFLYFYPLWTGLPMTADAVNGHIWFAFVKPLPNWCLCYWTTPG